MSATASPHGGSRAGSGRKAPAAGKGRSVSIYLNAAELAACPRKRCAPWKSSRQTVNQVSR